MTFIYALRHRDDPRHHNAVGIALSAFALVLSILALALALICAPAAHADDPYSGPHCDPMSGNDYNSTVCMDEPRNDPSCSAEGNQAQCMSDFLEGQRMEHNLYNTTPN